MYIPRRYLGFAYFFVSCGIQLTNLSLLSFSDTISDQLNAITARSWAEISYPIGLSDSNLIRLL